MFHRPIPTAITARIPELVGKVENATGVEVHSYPADEGDETEFMVTVQHSPVNIERADKRRIKSYKIKTVEIVFDSEGVELGTYESSTGGQGHIEGAPSIAEEEWENRRLAPDVIEEIIGRKLTPEEIEEATA